MSKWFWLYVIGFLILTGTDIGTTLWAESKGVGQEFNQTVSDGAGMLSGKRLLAVNGIFLLFSASMLWWALQRRHQIAPVYLARPGSAALRYLYLNPFAAKRIPLSAFHYIAQAPAVLMLKLVVSLNNSLIAAGIPDLLTPLATLIDSVVGNNTVTYWTFIVVLLHPIWWASLHLTALVLRREKAQSA